MKTTANAVGLSFMRLDVYRVARELAVRVGRAAIADAEVRAQAHRAATSVLLNLSEGLPMATPGARRRHLTVARGSAHEVAAAIDLASALGRLDESEAAAILVLCDRVSAMLWRLMR